MKPELNHIPCSPWEKCICYKRPYSFIFPRVFHKAVCLDLLSTIGQMQIYADDAQLNLSILPGSSEISGSTSADLYMDAAWYQHQNVCWVDKNRRMDYWRRHRTKHLNRILRLSVRTTASVTLLVSNTYKFTSEPVHKKVYLFIIIWWLSYLKVFLVPTIRQSL